MDHTKLLPGLLEGEDKAAFVSIAEAAAMGARNAVLDEVHRVADAPEAVVDVGAGAPLVAGILPLSLAEFAAAEGAVRSVRVAICLLPSAARKLVSSADLLQVEAAAAVGAVAGVRGSVFMAPLHANPAVLDKNFVATAAGSGAYATCYHMIRDMPQKSMVNQWASKLPPVLGASMALALGVHSRFASSNDTVVLLLYGGLFLVIFMLMAGIVAVPFSSTMSSEGVSRHVTFACFTTLLLLLTVALCTLLTEMGSMIFAGVVGGLAAAFMIYLWWRSGRNG